MNTERDSSAIIVLSMHRSGSSAVTGALQLCGAWIGEDDELTGAGRQNPKGFFERKDLRRLCDKLLHSAGFDWWKLSGFDLSAIPADVRNECQKQVADLVAGLQKHGVWAIKEPRLCLLFPILRAALTNPVCIMVVRDPFEVAESLRVRNGIPILNGLALWERYQRASLSASEGCPRVFIRYDRLLEDPIRETERLVSELGSLGVTGLSVNPEIANFISDDFYRSKTSFEEELLSVSARDLWQNLKEGTVPESFQPSKMTPEMQQRLIDLEEVYSGMLARKADVDEMRQERGLLKDALAGHKGERVLLHDNVTRLQSELDALRATLAELEHDRTLQGGRLEEFARERDELKDALTGYKGERVLLHDNVARLQSERDALDTALKEEAEEKSGLEAENEDLRRSGDALRATLAELEHERTLQGGRLEELAQERDELSATLVQLHEQQGRTLDSMSRQLALNTYKLSETAARMSQAGSDATVLREELTLEKQRNHSLVSDLKRVSAELKKTRTDHAEAQQLAEFLSSEVTALRGSTSWRISRPVRAFGTAFRRVTSPSGGDDTAAEVPAEVPSAAPPPPPAEIMVTDAPPEAEPEKRADHPEYLVPAPCRIIVYTCVYGAYEPLRTPPEPDPRVRWILFTDDPGLKSDFFEVHLVTEARSSIRRSSRMPKILPHKYLPPHDISLYIDGSLMIRDPNVVKFALDSIGTADIALFPHHARSNVFEEIAECLDLGLERREVCTHFERLYAERGAAEDFPLFENMLILRRNTDDMCRCNDLWWEHYSTSGAQRDQLSLALAMHDCGINPKPIVHGKQVRFNDLVDWKKHKRTTLPAVRPRVFVFIPYAPPAYGQDLGGAYNDYMERLGPDDWALFLDHDARLCGSHFTSLLNEIAQGYAGKEVMVTGLTNRINNPYQRVSQFEDSHDIAVHDRVSNAQFSEYRDTLYRVTDMPSTSGFILMLSRKTWEKHRFISGFLSVDNAMHKSFRGGNGHVLLSPALYAYHFYRADGDLSHAVRITQPIQEKTPPADGKILPNHHAIRTFVHSGDDGLTLADYLPLLRPGEWAVFVSSEAIFAQKTWNRRLYGLVVDLPKDQIISFAVIPAAEGRATDHLKARVIAQSGSGQVIYGETTAGFAAPFELIERTCDAGQGHLEPWKLPGTADDLFSTEVVPSDIHLHRVPRPFPAEEPSTELLQTLRESRRIAMLTLGFWPQQAGMEMMFHNLATQMTRAGDQVVLFTPKPKDPFEEIEHNYIIRRYSSEEEFHKLFDQHQTAMPFDCILVQGAFSAATLALEAGDRHGVQVVLRTHGEDIQIDEEIGYGYRLNAKKASVIEDNIRRVAHNVSISEPIGEETRAITPDGPVTVISNGVDTTHFHGERGSKIREMLPQIGADTCILLTVGRNVKKKAFDLAVEALANLVGRGLDVCLVHVGKEGNGIDLAQKAAELGVEDRFHKLGKVSYFDMPGIYASTDIFVFPSKVETFGNVTIEAMSSGLPCVEFDYQANREKIVEGETGRIIPWGNVPALADAIADLVVDPELRALMGAAARRAALERFDWSVIVEKYRAVIRQAAGGAQCEKASGLDRVAKRLEV